MVYTEPLSFDISRKENDVIVDLGLDVLKTAKTANMNNWGKDSKHNTCYITGHAGSGKSTVAFTIKRRGDIIVNLDRYSQSNNIENTEFDDYLDHEVEGWRKIASATYTGEKGTIKLCGDEYWSIVERFSKALENYSMDKYDEGNRVIVEGIQIADNWLYSCSSYYIDKPIIILTTDIDVSLQRVIARDKLRSEDMNKYLGWYMDTETRLNNLIRVTSAT